MKHDDDDDEVEKDEDDEYESYELEALVNLYLIHYKVFGQNNKLLLEIENNYIGVDVSDIIEELKIKLLGVEINTKDENGKDFHAVAERLHVLNAEWVAPIHGLTSVSLKVFAEYYKDIRQEIDDQE